MPDLSKLLLLDIFNLTLIMLGLGLIAYALIRRSNPLIRWHEHGNVWTDPFLKIDLLIMALIVGSYYMLIRHSVNADTSTTSGIEAIGIVSAIVSQFVSMTVLIGGIVFVLAYVRRVDIVELFGFTRLSTPKLILWSLGAFALTLPVVLGVALGWGSLLEYAFGTEPEQQQLVTIMRETSSLPVKLLIAFSACVFAPITEEILFRGYFYPALKRFSDRLFAALIVSMLFALIHSNTMSILPLFVLAMSFTIAYELTGCLLVPITMHALFNTTQVMLMFATPPNG
jgi:membrane protease YdiL (CAAX protease family)